MRIESELIAFFEILRRALWRAEDATRRAADQVHCASMTELDPRYVADQLAHCERALADAGVAYTQLVDTLTRFLQNANTADRRGGK